MGQPRRAEAIVDRYIDLEKVDHDHLAHAIRVYTEVGSLDKAKKAFQRLMKMDPGRARELVAFDDDIRRALV
jgi:DNA-binding SARP family transcriptional activator